MSGFDEQFCRGSAIVLHPLRKRKPLQSESSLEGRVVRWGKRQSGTVPRDNSSLAPENFKPKHRMRSSSRAEIPETFQRHHLYVRTLHALRSQSDPATKTRM